MYLSINDTEGNVLFIATLHFDILIISLLSIILVSNERSPFQTHTAQWAYYFDTCPNTSI